MAKSEGWYDDPALDGRRRFWNGQRWTANVADADGDQYEEVYLGADCTRWQYGVVNIGMFSALERMRVVLGTLGSEGWELVTIYDKASNWMMEMEKGFILLKRPVPAGVRLTDDQWCIAVRI